MSTIKQIVDYFFYHPFSKKMVNRVHARLIDDNHSKEKDEALYQLWQELGSVKADAGTAQSFQQIEHKLGHNKTMPQYRPSKTKQMLRWMAYAAVVLIPLFSVAFSYYMYLGKQAYESVEFIEHFVPNGKREYIRLPDNSGVWLNSGSMIIYPSHFKGDKRSVYLSGEAYFEVQKNVSQAFVVRTRLLNVEVLGTHFNLTAYPESQRIITTLEEGSVQVSLTQDDNKKYVLQANEQLIYYLVSQQVLLQKVNAPVFSEWKEGGLIFNNEPFIEIIRTIEHRYNVQVQLNNSAYNNNNLTLNFNKNEKLSTVLFLIKETIQGLDYEIVGNTVFVN
ncbi:anti-sigma factor [Bacteroidales bacterium]|nr:anti-sigma factor [Bacteroidales bacterium]